MLTLASLYGFKTLLIVGLRVLGWWVDLFGFLTERPWANAAAGCGWRCGKGSEHGCGWGERSLTCSRDSKKKSPLLLMSLNYVVCLPQEYSGSHIANGVFLVAGAWSANCLENWCQGPKLSPEPQLEATGGTSTRHSYAYGDMSHRKAGVHILCYMEPVLS